MPPPRPARPRPENTHALPRLLAAPPAHMQGFSYYMAIFNNSEQ